MDLLKGYYQIPLTPSEKGRKKVVVALPYFPFFCWLRHTFCVSLLLFVLGLKSHFVDDCWCQKRTQKKAKKPRTTKLFQFEVWQLLFFCKFFRKEKEVGLLFLLKLANKVGLEEIEQTENCQFQQEKMSLESWHWIHISLNLCHWT